MLKFFYLAVGGAMGAVLRYLLSGVVSKAFDGAFPWGTLVVNLVGCFFIGFFWQVFAEVIVPSTFRAFLLIGVLGALTTFSTFSLETMLLLMGGELKLGLANILLSTVFGLILVFLGMEIASLMLKLIK